MSYNKYQVYKHQISYDSGYTWETIPGEVTYSGNPLGTYDTLEECENSSSYKYLEIARDGTTYSEPCKGCGYYKNVLYGNDVKLISSSGNPTHLYVGDCVYDVYFDEMDTLHYFSGITFSHNVKEINSIVGYRHWSNPDIEQTLVIPNSVERIAMGGSYWNNHGFTGVENIVFEENSSLKEIGSYFMHTTTSSNEYIKNIDIPDSVEYIGNNAFQGCSALTSVHLPVGLKKIPYSLFANCTSLSGITIPSGVTYIDSEAFYNCSSLTSITIPDRVDVIESTAFRGCSFPNDGAWHYAGSMIYNDDFVRVSSVPTIPDGTKFIGYNGFSMSGSSLDWSGFKIPSSVKFIQNPNPKFYTYIDENSVKYIDTYCVGMSGASSQLTSYTIKSGTRFIGGLGSMKKLASLTLPESLEVICDNYSLGGFSALTSVTIPANVWYIGEYAFNTFGSGNSALTSVVFSSNSKLKYMNKAFRDCYSLEEITIPKGVVEMSGAFQNCSGLTSVTFEEGSQIEAIGADAFRDCKNLKRMNSNVDGVINIPSSVKIIDKNAFMGCESIEQINFPSGVTVIKLEAFYGCTALTSVRIPENVKIIPASCFQNCSGLTSVEIPSNVRKIDDGAFDACPNISSYTIPEGVEIINWGALQCVSGGTIIMKPTCPPGLGPYPFRSGLTIYVPCESYYDYLAAPGWSDYASDIHPMSPCDDPPMPSYEYKLMYRSASTDTYTVIPCNSSSAITSGETSNIGRTSVTTIIAGDCAYSIDNNAFKGFSVLSDVTLTNNLLSVGNYSFSGCTSLSAISIPDSTISLGNEAFRQCTNLISCSVGSGLTSIGSYCFYNDSNLTGITIPQGVSSITNSCFSRCTSLSSINIQNGVTNIGESAFTQCISLTNVSIPDSVTTIGYAAFSGCTSLISCTLGSGLTEINSSAFQGCTSLRSIVIPSGVTYIRSVTFSNCSGLTSVTIPNTVTNIGINSFADCTSLTGVSIPDSVTYIDGSAFWGCSGMITLTLGTGLTSIEGGAFSNCISISGLTIPDNVTNIGYSAFKQCSGMTELLIGSGVTSIGHHAFYNCSGLTSITCLATTPPTLEKDAPYGQSYAFNGSDCPIFVPSSSVNAYKSASEWSRYSSRIQAIP